MNQIIFEDLGNGLDLTRITFICERSLFERNEFEINRFRTQQRRLINDAIMSYHRERELNERILLYHIQENILNRLINLEIYPDDFWEPVKVTTTIDQFEFQDIDFECFICREQKNKKTQMKCCNQELCAECVEKWFTKESVHCPFCKHDIRN